MKQGSIFGNRIVWRGRPAIASAPLAFRLLALVLALVACVTTAFAIVVASALKADIGSLVFFAAFCASLALGLTRIPAIWRQRLEYLITEDHVIYRRGSFHRTIERQGISYARIHWHKGSRKTGDLELVRAVPTGALRRRLTLTLPGLEAPDAVWALIRDVEPPNGGQDGSLLMSQRLEEGERVLWSARPRNSWRHLLPEARDLGNLGLALLVGTMLVRQLMVAIPVTQSVLEAGVPASSLSFVALMAAFGIASLLLLGISLSFGYIALVRPIRRSRETRYFITDRRVLIQRGREELSLDRRKIVDIIDRPRRGGEHDLFLVLDGPRARALATSGAFGRGRRKDSLIPVLRAIVDPESVHRLLRDEPPPLQARAAAD